MSFDNVHESWCRIERNVKICTHKMIMSKFSSLSTFPGEPLMSAPFGVDNTKWELRVCLGTHDDDSKEYMSVFLHPLFDVSRDIRTEIKMMILDEKGNVSFCTTSSNEIFRRNQSVGHGWPKWILYSRVVSDVKYHSGADEVTLVCRLKYFYRGDSNLQSVGTARACQQIVINDLANLLATGRLSDVVFKVDGRQFHAHRAILAARSPVFAAMFDSDLVETNSGEVVVPDIAPEDFFVVLQYMYTGQLVRPEGFNSLEGVMVAADKYQLIHLRNTCEDILCSTLTADNVCRRLALADTHQTACRLRHAALSFIRTTDVTNSLGWFEMARNHHLLTMILRSSGLSNSINYRNNSINNGGGGSNHTCPSSRRDK